MTQNEHSNENKGNRPSHPGKESRKMRTQGRRFGGKRPERPYKNIDEFMEAQPKFAKSSTSVPMDEGIANEMNSERAWRDKKQKPNKERAGRDTKQKPNKERTGHDNKQKTNQKRTGHDNKQKLNKERTGRDNKMSIEASNPEGHLEGRNAVQEAFRSGRTIDKLFVQEDLHDGPITSILRQAKKHNTIVNFVSKERLNQMSETGKHQGVIAFAAAFQYASLEEILQKAQEKGEDPFLFILDGIEDPHNLGAIIRTANMAGAHGVIIGKHRAAGLTATAVRASAGALNFTPVAKVTNLGSAIEQLKQEGMWFVCADMGGTCMYDLEMKGSVGIVIGNEGEGVSRLIKEKCDFIASIPTKGDIDSLNASVAAGVLGFEIARQRG